MPAKKPGMTPEQQSEEFRKVVRELVAAGELNPTDADAAFETLWERVKPEKKPD
jgi:polyhydroxyalkanoate synthesis regulator phasin